MAWEERRSCLEAKSVRSDGPLEQQLTVLKVHGDVVAANIRGHGNDGSIVKLPNQMTCRNTVKIRHDDIHQNHIILRSSVHLVDSLKSIELYDVRHEIFDQALTAVSIWQWKEYKNFPPIRRHVGSSSTSRICGGRNQRGSSWVLFFLPWPNG